MSFFNSNSNVFTAENTGFKSRFHNHFDILNLLGKGAYGVVFEVNHKIDGRKYAIKRIDLANQPKELMEREIKIKDCHHCNIVAYYNSWIEEPPPKWQEDQDIIWKTRFHKMPIPLPYYGYEVGESLKHTDDGVSSTSPTPSTPPQPTKYLYIQMECCQKDNLADWLLKSDVPVRKTKYLTIFKEIVAAVKYLGSKGLIYRDLKPENILFGLDGSIRIGDFGTVTEHGCQTNLGDKKIRNTHRNNITHTDGIGTEGYRAPELEGTHYDYKVDIFSLGVILYELITPFHSDEERFSAIDHLRNSPFPKNFDTNFDNEYDLLKKMVSRNPKKRPTIGIIEEHLARWGASDIVSSSVFDYFTTFFTFVKQDRVVKTVHHIVKRENLPKVRPRKMSKDHHILQ